MEEVPPMPAPGGIVGLFKGVMTVSGDIDKPAIPLDEWEVFSNPEQVVNPELQLVDPRR